MYWLTELTTKGDIQTSHGDILKGTYHLSIGGSIRERFVVMHGDSLERGYGSRHRGFNISKIEVP